MGPLHAISAPPPALSVAGDRAPVANAYFAVTIDAAVDLLDAPGYRNLTRRQRVAKALAEQQGFLSGFLDPGLHAALDLRVAVDPAASTPLSLALLGRVWGASAEATAERAEGLRGRLKSALPRHVAAAPVADADAVARLLAPFPGATADSAVITRHELIGAPARPDAGVSYYYSATPFTWSDDDWSGVYAALAASPVPLVFSVAVLPMLVPAPFAQTLRTLATFYRRLARDAEAPGGYYPARPRLAADPFAVEAEQAFHEYCARISHKAYALRIQLSAARKLPPGIVEAIAAAISPAGEQPPGPGAPVPAYDVRRPGSVAERRLAEYNLNVINFGILTGQREIWGRLDPPDPRLAMLPVLGDARDASCAFRFPVAADGAVPGFTVRRAQPGPSAGQGPEAHRPGGHGARPVVWLGTVHGTDGHGTDGHGAGRAVTVPLRSLTGHALLAGPAGASGTAASLLRQLWADHRVPFLVIDPGRSADGGYRELAAQPGLTELEVITAGDESRAPLRFNPFEVPAGALAGEHAATLLTCFTAAYGLTGPLTPVYQDALSLTYLRAGFLAAERPAGGRAWPTVVDFLAAMEEVTAGLRYPAEAAAAVDAGSVRRARQLVRGSAGSALLTSRPAGLGQLLDHPVILDLSALGPGDEQALLMALLLNAVAGHGRWARDPAAELSHVTLVADAHLLLGRAAGTVPGPDAQARERAAVTLAGLLTASGRHGECVLVADPAPGRLVQPLVQGTSLKVIGRLTAADDRRVLAEALPRDEAQRVVAARLPAGQALLYGDELAGPVHADTGPADTPAPADTAGPANGSAPADTREPAATPEPADTREPADTPEPEPAAAPGVRPLAPLPFPGCDQCRARCAYRGAALSILNDTAAVTDLASTAQAALPAAEPATEPATGPAARPATWPAGRPDFSPAGLAGLAGLRARLFYTVGRFPALPAAGQARADAAFCLFLHVHATTPLRRQPQWPDAAARVLDISAATDETGAGADG